MWTKAFLTCVPDSQLVVPTTQGTPTWTPAREVRRVSHEYPGNRATEKTGPSPAAGEAESVGENVLVSCPAWLKWLQSGQHGVQMQVTQGMVSRERAEIGRHCLSGLTQERRRHRRSSARSEYQGNQPVGAADAPKKWETALTLCWTLEYSLRPTCATELA